MATALASAAVIALIAGFVVPRWPIVVVAAAFWPLFVLSRALSLWGHGLGDGWFYALAMLTGVSAASAAIGVFASRLGIARRRRLRGRGDSMTHGANR